MRSPFGAKGLFSGGDLLVSGSVAPDLAKHTAYLEDHTRTCKWLGSPSFTSHFRAFGRETRLLGGLTITMVINHLVIGMILQVGNGKSWTMDPVLYP